MFNLTCCKFVRFKENTLTHYFQNHQSKQIKHPPQCHLYEECPLRDGIQGWNQGGEVQLLAKMFEFRHSVGYNPDRKIESPYPSSDQIPHIGKKEKVSLIAQRQILPKFLVTTCIFNQKHYLFEKFLGTKSRNTKQFPVGLSPKIILLYRTSDQKLPLLCCCFVAPTRCGLFHHSLNLCRKP